MAYRGSQTNAEFGLGVNHVTNAGRGNAGSITLNGSAGISDEGLDSTSAGWNSLTPRGVLASVVGGSQDDTPWEQLQRDSGGYEPGQMPVFEDQLTNGSDNQQ
jgi:hypothetical protein